MRHFLSGATFFGHVSDCFSDPFRVFQTIFRIDLKTFFGGNVVLQTCRRNKQGLSTFAWRPGCQYDDAATRRADTVLASGCRACFDKEWDVTFV